MLLGIPCCRPCGTQLGQRTIHTTFRKATRDYETRDRRVVHVLWFQYFVSWTYPVQRETKIIFKTILTVLFLLAQKCKRLYPIVFYTGYHILDIVIVAIKIMV